MGEFNSSTLFSLVPYTLLPHIALYASALTPFCIVVYSLLYLHLDNLGSNNNDGNVIALLPIGTICPIGWLCRELVIGEYCQHTHTYIGAHTHTHSHTHAHTLIHILTHSHTHTHTHTLTHSHTHTLTYTHTCTNTYTHVYMPNHVGGIPRLELFSAHSSVKCGSHALDQAYTLC